MNREPSNPYLDLLAAPTRGRWVACSSPATVRNFEHFKIEEST
jgi:hypothetical protein